MQDNKQREQNILARYIPVVGWLPTYRKEWLRVDVVAGVTLWGVVVPMAMAYATMAGVSPQSGLYTALIALAAYAVFGTSRHIKVTASSTMAIMSAAVIAPLAGSDPARFASLTAMLALLVGGILIIAGIAKLGFISDFLSKSVITGFVFGVALNIVISQAPKLFGVPAGSGDFFQQVTQLVSNLGQTNPWTFAVGATSLALILVLKRVAPRIPASLVALILGILASSLLDLSQHGVSVVGVIPTGIPLPSIPGADLRDIPYLLTGAAGIVIIAVGESLGTARAFAAKYHYEIQPNQELIALGIANVGTGLFQGFAADASLSSSATADAAGGRTQLNSVVASVLVLVTVGFFASVFRNLPNSVLAAILITSVTGLMDVAELRRFYALRKADFWLAITALVGVIMTDVLTGLAIAVILSIALVVYRASRPYIAVLGRLQTGGGDSEEYGDMARNKQTEPIQGLLILRFDAPLYFFNANVARSQIFDVIAGSDPPPRAILLDVGASSYLDIATTDMLDEIVTELSDRKIQVMLANAKGSTRDTLRRTHLMEKIGEEHVYMSTQSAVRDFLLSEQSQEVVAAAVAAE